MILRIWIKLFFIVLLAVVPLMAAQYYMQKESVELAFELTEKSSPVEFMNSYLAHLKKLSQLDPVHSESYRAEFERAAESGAISTDMKLVRTNLVSDLLLQTLRNTVFILLAALAATYFIARSIVALLRRLIVENETNSLRLERMQALESWQKVARMMVHELRAPITPIKLIATDIESKHQALDSESFRQYLARGTEVIRDQMIAIERLTDGLTKFAKLPEVQCKTSSLAQFLRKFVETYKDYSDSAAQFTLAFADGPEVPIAFDETLLNLLFFNLLKNALEANPQRKVEIHIDCRQGRRRTLITFTNFGHRIPEPLAQEIFNMHVSTKSANSTSNFGVGLTIAKKIALDHNGDIRLAKNEAVEAGLFAVAFELELPNR